MHSHRHAKSTWHRRLRYLAMDMDRVTSGEVMTDCLCEARGDQELSAYSKIISMCSNIVPVVFLFLFSYFTNKSFERCRLCSRASLAPCSLVASGESWWPANLSIAPDWVHINLARRFVSDHRCSLSATTIIAEAEVENLGTSFVVTTKF